MARTSPASQEPAPLTGVVVGMADGWEPAVQRKDPTMTRKIMIALGVAALGISATACNTVKGAGQDIESVGQAGEDAID